MRGVTTEQKRAAGTHEPGEFRDERAGRERACDQLAGQRPVVGRHADRAEQMAVSGFPRDKSAETAP
jgi:hypothetical protein